MDRLICGDVGFGKTEVAMRAAFLVAISGRQVLVLAPTTLLAQQHLQTFRDRFRDFPVRVEAVSRMRDAARGQAGAARVRRGQDRGADRHPPRCSRATSSRRQLGLIVVDEEQRFGVRQKELLRAAAARGRRALDVGDADPAHAAHVARRACATSR